MTGENLVGYAFNEELAKTVLRVASNEPDDQRGFELRDLFASAMTGNTALLALAASRGDWLAASRSLSALLSFGIRLLALELVFLVGGSVLWRSLALPDPDNPCWQRQLFIKPRDECAPIPRGILNSRGHRQGPRRCHTL